MIAVPPLTPRRAVVVGLVGIGCLFLLLAATAPFWHRLTVTDPAARAFATALGEIEQHERAAHARSGSFVPFSSAPGAIEAALPAANADKLRSELFAFRATVAPDGTMTLLGWTRPEAIRNAEVPAFAATRQFSADGKLVRQAQTVP